MTLHLSMSRTDHIMEKIRVAAVSMNPQRNLATIAQWCEKAAMVKAELVVIPELVVYGLCTPNTWRGFIDAPR